MSKKKKKSGGIFWNFLLLVSVAVFLVAAWKLYGYWRHYHDGKKEYESLREYVKEDANSDKKDEKKDVCPITVDFDALAKVNPDVKAWLYIEGTGINYPVVQSKDNNYYLHKTFEGRDSYIAAIFLDAACASDFSSDNSIIYGHNLKNGEMFGMLKKNYDTAYNSDADYTEHRKIWVVTPKAQIEYEVFAAREIDVNADKDVYTIDFATEEEYAAYLKKAAAKSLYQTDTKVSEENPMLTLSTCTSSSEAGRFIVQATQIQRIAGE